MTAGELIEITDRGRPVARLVPMTDVPWQGLIAAGEVVPASRPIDVRDLEPRDYGFSASAALQRLRADDRQPG